ncbi:hypothetical protein WICPIJ_009505 [Wickerhamomyces pijperi]|uniref:Uncharacterized protein n=1 Tax=Wickerhamomyces pijperi TaxID=599730 RepID=A0A9P8PMD1_WICPI|nr:hypothetical protein WICPIJ_009505 [Wickerhamomyces pijperi]
MNILSNWFLDNATSSSMSVPLNIVILDPRHSFSISMFNMFRANDPPPEEEIGPGDGLGLSKSELLPLVLLPLGDVSFLLLAFLFSSSIIFNLDLITL